MPKRSTRKARNSPAREDAPNGAVGSATKAATQPAAADGNAADASAATARVTNQIVINAFARCGRGRWGLATRGRCSGAPVCRSPN